LRDVEKFSKEEPGMDNLASNRLVRLLTYLEHDPDNASLLQDAAQTALDIADIDKAGDLVERLIIVNPEGYDGQFLAGVVAMHRKDFSEACTLFEKLADEHNSPVLKFNLAWSHAMTGNKSRSLELLDDGTMSGIAAATMLKVQLLHEAGKLNEALSAGKAGLKRFPADTGLLGVMATLAIDLEDVELARFCADRSGDHPEGLAAAGFLDLRSGATIEAKHLFEKSLQIREHNPRAWTGRGLIAIMEHDALSGARDLDRAAKQFERHVGAWIAAGWAYYLANELALARHRFEHALSLDANFAECHGSLAVMDIVTGNRDGGKRRMVTALRLDPRSFSAALANLLLNNDNPVQSKAIVERAMTTPLGSDGLTLTAFLSTVSRPTLH